MPTSQHLQINAIMDFIIDTNPSKLLDIGVGFGKYGFLSREYLEFWDGRDQYGGWLRLIDGIEAYEKYITPVHKFIYNTIFIGNALDVLPTLENKYDLILIIDVLEHFSREDGLKLLQECLIHGKNILISVPKHVIFRGKAFNNPYEAHVFQWEKSHFRQLLPEIVFSDVGGSLIVYMGEKSHEFLRERRLAPIKEFQKRMNFLYFSVRAVLISMINLVHLKQPLKRLLNR
jgi:hypothetical protein